MKRLDFVLCYTDPAERFSAQFSVQKVRYKLVLIVRLSDCRTYWVSDVVAVLIHELTTSLAANLNLSRFSLSLSLSLTVSHSRSYSLFLSVYVWVCVSVCECVWVCVCMWCFSSYFVVHKRGQNGQSSACTAAHGCCFCPLPWHWILQRLKCRHTLSPSLCHT